MNFTDYKNYIFLNKITKSIFLEYQNDILQSPELCENLIKESILNNNIFLFSELLKNKYNMNKNNLLYYLNE